MKVLKSFARFWYDFIVGDDWKIAAGVVAAVALSVAVLRADILSDTALCILGAALVVAAFSLSMVIEVRPRRRRRSVDSIDRNS